MHAATYALVFLEKSDQLGEIKIFKNIGRAVLQMTVEHAFKYVQVSLQRLKGNNFKGAKCSVCPYPEKSLTCIHMYVRKPQVI